MIKANIEALRENIKRAAERSGRGAGDVSLVCVTKEASLEQIKEALDCGITDIGESRVQAASAKFKALRKKPVRRHLLGHLQTNKASEACRIFDLIHSVDSLKLAQYINKEAGKLGKTQEVLVEVNVSGEKTKFGIEPAELEKFLESTKGLVNINITGLMTVTPLTDTPEDSRPYFRALRELSEKYGLGELSMGMTQDYAVAIEEGATMVRVGRAIFKE